MSWDVLKRCLARLLDAVDDDDYTRVRHILRETVSGYAPDGEIVDWLYQERRQDPRL